MKVTPSARRSLVLASCAAISLTCSSESAPPVPVTVTIESSAALDGYITMLAVVNDQLVQVGNSTSLAGELVNRGFVSFDLVTSIPADATIQSAQLRFFQGGIVGDPYGKLGSLLLKHVEYGGLLDLADFDAAEMGSMMLPAQTAANEFYTVTDPSIATWIQDDLDSGRPRFQVRLQFETELDGAGSDHAQIESADDSGGSGNVPELTVTYVR